MCRYEQRREAAQTTKKPSLSTWPSVLTTGLFVTIIVGSMIYWLESTVAAVAHRLMICTYDLIGSVHATCSVSGQLLL